jgi:type II secretory pathway component PulF
MAGLMDKWNFRLTRRLALYARLSDFMENGFPVEATLETVAMRYAKRKDPRAKIINEWRKKLALGQKFADVIKNHVPSEERVLISAGEMGGGGLAQGLKEAVRMGEAMSKIKSTIISNMMYPLSLAVALIGIFLMFSWKVAPVFKEILREEEWPESGKTLLFISDFFGNHLLLLFSMIVAVGALSMYLLPRWVGRGRKIANYFPPFSIYMSYQSSSFLIALSSMMNSGISLSESLQRINEKSSPWLSSHVSLMMMKLRVSGSDYGKALNTGMLDDEVAGDIEDYAKLSTFEKAIYSIGNKTMEKTVKTIESRMGIIKNVMLVLVAIVVAWVGSTSGLLQQTVADNAGKQQQSVQRK